MANKTRLVRNCTCDQISCGNCPFYTRYRIENEEMLYDKELLKICIALPTNIPMGVLYKKLVSKNRLTKEQIIFAKSKLDKYVVIKGDKK